MIHFLFKIKRYMKDSIVRFLFMARVETIAPVTGGGVGFLAWCAQLAPLFSVTAALIGVFIGILSYSRKNKLVNLEIEKKELEIQILKDQENES